MALLLLLPGGLAAILVVFAAVWRVQRSARRSFPVSSGPGARIGGQWTPRADKAQVPAGQPGFAGPGRRARAPDPGA